MKLIFLSPLVQKTTLWFSVLVSEGFVALGTRASESSLLFSFRGWRDSGHRFMRPYIEWLSTELWLQSSCNHTVSALTPQLLHSSPEQWFVFAGHVSIRQSWVKGFFLPALEGCFLLALTLSQRISVESMFKSCNLTNRWGAARVSISQQRGWVALSRALLSPGRCYTASHLPVTYAIPVLPISSPPM